MNNVNVFVQAKNKLNPCGQPSSMGSMPPFETAAARVTRLYQAESRALVAWLMDEAHLRQQEYQDMARELGVTTGYINQLKTGIRLPENISHEFAVACAQYLRVPAIVVKLVSGSIRISDFAFPNESEEQMLDRALRTMKSDPQLRAALPGNLMSLPVEAKKMMVAMYAESSTQDVFGLHELPEMLRWLQRAAVIHGENEFEAAVGHRDTSAQ